MDVKDIKMEPGQVAVLIWMNRNDCYNVAGVFETVQLAYEHAMEMIFPKDIKDSVYGNTFRGFCIETRNVLRESEKSTIGTDDEDYYAHEEYYFNETGELDHALGNYCATFGATFYMNEERQRYIEELTGDYSEEYFRDYFRYHDDPEAIDEAAEEIFLRYEKAFRNLAE